MRQLALALVCGAMGPCWVRCLLPNRVLLTSLPPS
jgi:hypothetical protein